VSLVVLLVVVLPVGGIAQTIPHRDDDGGGATAVQSSLPAWEVSGWAVVWRVWW
jgi:hypothetical protein